MRASSRPKGTTSWPCRSDKAMSEEQGADAPSTRQIHHDYVPPAGFGAVMTISTRRFSVRPSAVALLASGWNFE